MERQKYLPYDPYIPLLDIYPREKKAYAHTKNTNVHSSFICNKQKLETIQMFDTGECTNQSGLMHTVEYHCSAVRSQVSTCLLFVYSSWAKNGFYIFKCKMVEKIIVYETLKFYEIPIPVSIKVYGTQPSMLIYLHIVCACFSSTMAELSCCNRDHMACKTYSI